VFESRFHCVAQAVLELAVFFPQPPECWDYRYVPPHPAVVIFNLNGDLSGRTGLCFPTVPKFLSKAALLIFILC
jgi:hypothetical protein